MVIIVLVGAVALLKAAKRSERGTGKWKTKAQRTKTKANDATASIAVMISTLPMLFLISFILKNSPAVKAINTKAISLIKSVRDMNSCGIRFITEGPIRIPVTIYAVAFGNLNNLVSLVIKKPQIKITPSAIIMLLAVFAGPAILSASRSFSIKDGFVSVRIGNLHDSFFNQKFSDLIRFSKVFIFFAS